MTVSRNSPSMNARVPSISRPSATKNVVTVSRSATVMPTWSKRRAYDMSPSFTSWDGGSGRPTPVPSAGWGGERVDRDRVQPVGCEGLDFVAPQGPGRQLPGCAGASSSLLDREEGAARSDQAPDVDDGVVAGRAGQGLHGDDLDHQLERPPPRWRRIEQVGRRVADLRVGMAAAGQADGGGRDVECRRREPERGQVLGVGAQPAADDDRPLPAAVKVARTCPAEEQRVSRGPGPRKSRPGPARLPCRADRTSQPSLRSPAPPLPALPPGRRPTSQAPGPDLAGGLAWSSVRRR